MADAFDRSLLAAMAERGVTLNSAGNVVRIPGHSGPGPTDTQILAYNERQRFGTTDTNVRLRLQWAQNLALITETLSAQGTAAPWPFFGVFWIRLGGTLTDLRGHYENLFNLAKIDPETHAFTPGSLAQKDRALCLAIDAIQSQFTEDELVYADYRRHTEAHPTQTGYEVRLTGKGHTDMNNTRAIPTLGNKRFTIDQTTAAIRRVLAGYATEDHAAVAFAKRAHGSAQSFAALLRSMS